MKDLIKDFQDFLDSTKDFEERTYSFAEILKDFYGYQHLVMNQLYTRFNANPYGFCFPILVEQSAPQTAELQVYTLVEVMMLDSYTQMIPDNKFQHCCDLKKTAVKKFKEMVEIEAQGKKIKVEVDLYKTTFNKLNVKQIQFPDDYFLKGIPLLTEQLSKQFITGDTSSAKEYPYKNENFSIIKQITIKKICDP
ncbi:MAG: hypothetical protein ACOVP4_08535 [Bacteriovoracaceae bacterium]